MNIGPPRGSVKLGNVALFVHRGSSIAGYVHPVARCDMLCSSLFHSGANVVECPQLSGIPSQSFSARRGQMTDDVTGARKGDYLILGALGAGGMGKVYKVRNTLSDRVEAMKVLLPDLF